MARRRLDAELVRRGLVADRTEASAAIYAGLVTVGGVPATTVSTMVRTDVPVHVAAPEDDGFVSRGGDKLQAALDRFHVRVRGMDCLDVGASTGGFTDCLLKAGAARVIAVDVGYGQLAWSLRTDERVVVMERTNVRDLAADDLPFAPALVVVDLSFVSLRTALPPLVGLRADGGELIVLVKPQFEIAPALVEERGVVRDPKSWRTAVADVAAVAGRDGLGVRAAMASPILGRSGNVEFLLHLGVGGGIGLSELDRLIANAEDLVR